MLSFTLVSLGQYFHGHLQHQSEARVFLPITDVSSSVWLTALQHTEAFLETTVWRNPHTARYVEEQSSITAPHPAHQMAANAGLFA